MFGIYRFNGFSGRSNAALNCAVAQANELGHSYIGSEHLLLGLLKRGGGVAHTLLHEQGISEKRIKEQLCAGIGTGIPERLSPGDMTRHCRRILEIALIEAHILGGGEAQPEHLFLSLLRSTDCYAFRLLRLLGYNSENSFRRLTMAVGAENSGRHDGGYGTAASYRASARTPMLEHYGQDITLMARMDRLDPVIGREKEIERVMQILIRRSKNNPCLIGEAGVGKTAIVEGLAQRLLSRDAPEILRGKRIISADISGMVAGAKYRGDFEERIRGCIEEASRSDNIILFIDELHSIVGAGAAEGAVDAANILKPMLARGQLRVIGATTSEEYRRYILRDSALERRFQSVTVSEPDENGCINMLYGLRAKYEAHHGVRISDEACAAAVRLSVKYMPERRLPDKALDLIDEACAGIRLEQCRERGKNPLMERKKKLSEQKSSAIRSQDFELAASLRDKERPIESELSASETTLSAGHIARLVENTAGLEHGSAGFSGKDRLEEELFQLEQRLSERVIGQEEAVRAVSVAVRRSRAGLCEENRPAASFLFMGPTGVGKTELAKAMASAVFGSEKALIRLDMSEFMEKHSIARLLGAPPGYVGFDEGGKLTEAVRRRPSSVVLFDEIEKAHPDVASILLQILDEGELTDSQGRTVSFRNTLIAVTSNIGAKAVRGEGCVGFAERDLLADRSRDAALRELGAVMPQELIGRFDETVLFSTLSKDDLEKIAAAMLEKLSARLRKNGCEVEFPGELAAGIARRSDAQRFGARRIRRTIRREVEEPLSGLILSGRLSHGKRYIFDGKLTEK